MALKLYKHIFSDYDTQVKLVALEPTYDSDEEAFFFNSTGVDDLVVVIKI